MKIAVVGNCQTVPMSAALRHYLPDMEFVPFEIWRFKGDQIRAEAEKLLGYDIILSQRIYSAHYGSFATKELLKIGADKGIPIHIFHNLFFEGALPDCRCLGKAISLNSAISMYHSNIVVDAFLENCSEVECLGRLRSGYGISVKEKWSNSEAQFVEREKLIDIPFAEELIAQSRSADSFHYFNHPKPVIMQDYAIKILKSVFDLTVHDDNWALPDMLAAAGSWPVYDWVSDELGLPYNRSQFISPYDFRPMDLPEFISKCYEIYSKTARDQLI